MNTSNDIISNMVAVRARASQLDCVVVAVLEDVILCHRSDNTFITWRASVYPQGVDFTSGCYDMTPDAAQSNMIDRAWGIRL